MARKKNEKTMDEMDMLVWVVAMAKSPTEREECTTKWFINRINNELKMDKNVTAISRSLNKNHKNKYLVKADTGNRLTSYWYAETNAAIDAYFEFLIMLHGNNVVKMLNKIRKDRDASVQMYMFLWDGCYWMLDEYKVNKTPISIIHLNEYVNHRIRNENLMRFKSFTDYKNYITNKMLILKRNFI